MPNPVEDWFCNDYLRPTPWIAYKLRTPGRRGVPDRLVVGPNGQQFFVEFKRERERVRPEQKREIGRLLALGQSVYIVKERHEAIKIFSYHDSGSRNLEALKKTFSIVMGAHGKGQDFDRALSNRSKN